MSTQPESLPQMQAFQGQFIVRVEKERFSPLFVDDAFSSFFSLKGEKEIDKFFNQDYRKFLSKEDQSIFLEVIDNLKETKQTVASFDANFHLSSTLHKKMHVILQLNHGTDQKTYLFGRLEEIKTREENHAFTSDPLTGLMESKEFFSLLPKLQKEHQEKNSGDPLVVLFFDIVNFRYINLYYGMESGDAFLKRVAKMLQNTFPEYIISRMDGDHFLALTDSIGLSKRVAETRKLIQRLYPGLSLDVSIGASLYDKEEFKPDRVCQEAKLASDYNRLKMNTFFSFYTEKIGEKLEVSEYVVSHIDEAVEKGWIEVYYQPIVRAMTSELCSFEALARFHDPKRGLLPPADFIEPLEQAQKIYKVDLAVIEQVCAMLEEHRKENLQVVPISVNLSRVDFFAVDIFSEVEKIIHKHHIPRQYLHIEVTESALVSHQDKILSSLDLFRQAGYEIWMDDFGNAYSTLSLLKNYTFDLIKIDMSFLRNETEQGRSIIASIIAMAKRIGNRTLCEGVETKDQLEFLCKAGVDKIQGYYFGKPLPYEESLEHCLSEGIGIELLRTKSYYDSLQTVNFQSDIPFMILEFSEGHYHVLFLSDSAIKTLEVHSEDPQLEVETYINDPNKPSHRESIKAAEHGIFSGISGNYLYIYNNINFRCNYKLLSLNEGKALFEIRLTDVTSGNNGWNREVKIGIALAHFYDDLYVINLSDHTILPVRSGVSESTDEMLSFPSEDPALKKLLPQIFPADEKRFEEFIDSSTLEERINKAPNGILRNVFRTKDSSGRYTYRSHRLIKIPSSTKMVILYGVRTMDVKGAEEELNTIKRDPYTNLIVSDKKKGKNNESNLFDDLMLHFPLPLFYKDKERRFLGASKSFLDYYGFTSLNAILGKRDEEMGWHPDNLPFRSDEEEVISTGKMHANVPGKCIAKGVAHNIMATKWPVFRNGESVGLMGYFLDEDMVSALTGAEKKTVRLDPDTGVENIPSFIEDFYLYNEEYETNKTPYAIIICTLPELDKIKSDISETAEKKAIATIANAICKATGIRGTIGHIRRNEFVILMKYQDPSEVKELSREIKKNIDAITSIDGIGLTLFASMRIIYATFDLSIEDFITNSLLKALGNANSPEEEQEEKEKDFLLFLSFLPIGAYVLKENNTISYINPALEKLLGYPSKEMVDKKVSETHVGSSLRSNCDFPSRFYSEKKEENTDILLLTKKDGNEILLRRTLAPLDPKKSNGGIQIGFLSPLEKMDNNSSLLEEYYLKATLDPLTSLPGKNFFFAALDSSFARYHYEAEPFGLFIARIKDNRKLEETLSKEDYEKVIYEVSNALKSEIRKKDKLSYAKPDSFYALFPLSSPGDSYPLAKRIEALSPISVPLKDGTKKEITLTFALTLVRCEDDKDSLLKRVKDHLVLAKKSAPFVLDETAEKQVKKKK